MLRLCLSRRRGVNAMTWRQYSLELLLSSSSLCCRGIYGNLCGKWTLACLPLSLFGWCGVETTTGKSKYLYWLVLFFGVSNISHVCLWSACSTVPMCRAGCFLHNIFTTCCKCWLCKVETRLLDFGFDTSEYREISRLKIITCLLVLNRKLQMCSTQLADYLSFISY